MKRFLGLLFSASVLLGMIPHPASAAAVAAGDYLGQSPPGLTPTLFAPGTVSTGLHEHSAADFSPDGTELFFSVAGAVWHTVLHMRRIGDRWTEPAVAPFSGQYPDDCTCFAHGGSRLYFCSRRPLGSSVFPEDAWAVWYVDRTETGWGPPQNEVMLTSWNAITPSFSRSGNAYFASDSLGGEGDLDIFTAEHIDGAFAEPRNLGPAVNSPSFEAWLFVDPDEQYLLFTSYGRTAGNGLYVSFRSPDGSWGEARSLGNTINGLGAVRMPRVSPDGKYLFFNVQWDMYPAHSEVPLTVDQMIDRINMPGNGSGDIFWVDAAIIEQAREMPHRDIMTALSEALTEGGIADARALYFELKNQYPHYYDFGERLLNDFGYLLLRRGWTTDAIAIFELNAEIYPRSANPYDSLAEAYMTSGDAELALENCRKALAIDPAMPTARRMLRELGGR
jgi:hypothetical protein